MATTCQATTPDTALVNPHPTMAMGVAPIRAVIKNQAAAPISVGRRIARHGFLGPSDARIECCGR